MTPYIFKAKEAFNHASRPPLAPFEFRRTVGILGAEQTDLQMFAMQKPFRQQLLAERGEGQLLSHDDPAEYTVLNEAGKANYIIVADHASRVVPKKLGAIVDDPQDMSRHIAWDIGTEDISRRMSEKMDAPAIIAGFSRLVIDLNRGFGHPQQVPTSSDGTEVLGNHGLTLGDIDARVKSLYNTYHNRLEKMVERATSEGKRPVIVFVHSCTPEMDGFKRPWEIGILWNKNRSLAKSFIRELADENPGFNIGDNQPYSLRKPLKGNSIEMHAESRNLPHVVIEFRQDLVDTPEKAQAMADMAIKCLERAVEREQKLKLKKVLGETFGQEAEKNKRKAVHRYKQEATPSRKPKALNTENW